MGDGAVGKTSSRTSRPRARSSTKILPATTLANTARSSRDLFGSLQADDQPRLLHQAPAAGRHAGGAADLGHRRPDDRRRDGRQLHLRHGRCCCATTSPTSRRSPTSRTGSGWCTPSRGAAMPYLALIDNKMDLSHAPSSSRSTRSSPTRTTASFFMSAKTGDSIMLLPRRLRALGRRAHQPARGGVEVIKAQIIKHPSTPTTRRRYPSRNGTRRRAGV